jgi:hypothetical protein
MSIKAIGILCALSLSLAYAASADSNEAKANEVQRTHELLLKHTLLGARSALTQVGPRLKIMASLEACKLQGLASALEPSSEELSQAVLEYVAATPEAMEVGVELIASIMSATLYYRFGYRERRSF